MMMKMYGMIKILGLLGVAHTGLGASISYINEGTISIKQVFVDSGVIITGTFCLMRLWKPAPSEIKKQGLPDNFARVHWVQKALFLLIQLLFFLHGPLLVAGIVLVLLLLVIDGLLDCLLECPAPASSMLLHPIEQKVVSPQTGKAWMIPQEE
ncbi:uncharacterized protein LOC131169342 [Hevea brasiliensis]|uniref:uncharacterized protein LOC131169342 n=1 Tax=Hevea brasiliensis TaxID=3981 RepID=UPI0025E6052F|nr:uncharacterized protein LOC131169342 [Hevea brasiliensis]